MVNVNCYQIIVNIPANITPSERRENLKISKGTIIRTVILILALVNQCLSITGHKVLPIQDEQVEELVSLLFTVITSLISWWKNNSFTENAIEADDYLRELKERQ